MSPITNLKDQTMDQSMMNKDFWDPQASKDSLDMKIEDSKNSAAVIALNPLSEGNLADNSKIVSNDPSQEFGFDASMEESSKQKLSSDYIDNHQPLYVRFNTASFSSGVKPNKEMNNIYHLLNVTRSENNDTVKYVESTFIPAK